MHSSIVKRVSNNTSLQKFIVPVDQANSFHLESSHNIGISQKTPIFPNQSRASNALHTMSMRSSQSLKNFNKIHLYEGTVGVENPDETKRKRSRSWDQTTVQKDCPKDGFDNKYLQAVHRFRSHK